MTSTSPLKEKILWWLAMHTPASLAYYVAVRVICHASVTKYRGTVMSDIRAMDVPGCWHDSMVASQAAKSTAAAS